MDEVVSHGVAAARTVHRIRGPSDQVVRVDVHGVPIFWVIVCRSTVDRPNQPSSGSLVVHVGVVQEDRVEINSLMQ